MNQRRSIPVVIVLLVLMSLVLTSSGALAQAGTSGVTIPYSSRLTDEAGQPVADGKYDVQFALYDAEKGGQLLWSETQSGIAVQGGALDVSLGEAAPIPNKVSEQKDLWLAVSVRGPNDKDFTLLNPRQSFNGPAAVSALTCPHSHFTDSWNGTSSSYGLIVSNGGTGDGIRAYSASPNNNYAAIWAVNTDSTGAGTAVYARSVKGFGVYGTSTSGAGVVGKTITTTGDTTGVWGEVASSGTYARGVVGWATKTTGINYGVWGESESSNGTGVYGQGFTGVRGYSPYAAGFGVSGSSANGDGVIGDTTDGVAVLAMSNGTGVGLEVDGQFSGNLIEAWHGPLFPDRRFYVSNVGNVYADGSYTSPAADMAEMLPAADGLEPGDVLVVGPNGHLSRSTQSNQASVVGVYSTKPAFVGGSEDGADPNSKIPLAVVGIVPVKVSAENGAIQPGDLLVASSLPGHAMRAPVNPAPGTVIGKALGTLNSGAGIVEMLVMLR